MANRFVPKNKEERTINDNLMKSKKVIKFLDNINERSRGYYRNNLRKYCLDLKIKDMDEYLKDSYKMSRVEEREYKFKLEDDIKKWSKTISERYAPKSWSVMINAVKQLLIANRIQLDEYFWKRIHNGKRIVSVSTKETPTPKQLREILTHADAESRALFLMQATSGSRIDEILSLDLEDVYYKDLDLVRFNVYYDKSKTKINIRKRASIETREALLEYLKVRDDIIETRIKRSNIECRESIDKNKLFPMSKKIALDKWNLLVEKAGLMKKSKHGNRGTMTTHCLRRFFKKEFSKYDKDWASYFRGKPTQDDRDYDTYTDEEIDNFYSDGVKHLFIDKIPIDTNIEVKKLKEQNKKIIHVLNKIMRLDEISIDELEKDEEGTFKDLIELKNLTKK